MALTTSKKMTLIGKSTVGGAQAVMFSMSIDLDNPGKAVPTEVKTNAALYQANLEECRADRDAFEAAAFALQKEIAAEAEEKADSEEEN